jgi:site-specific DNA recombinase
MSTAPLPRPAADLYLRLSDLRNEAQLDGREDRLRAEADRLGWDVHRVIRENDLAPTGADGSSRASAFKRKKIRLPNGKTELRTVRPGFRSMLDDLEAGIVQAILAEDLDRLVRQPRDGEDLLDAVEMSGATARSLTGSGTLTDGGTSDERFVARIMAATANKSSADTSRRIAASNTRRAGKSWIGGSRPYGYRHGPDSAPHRRTLVIDDEEAAVLRGVADDILDRGLSLSSVARDLNDRGITSATGRRWQMNTLRNTLLKPANAGLTTNPAVDGLIESEAWPAIFDRDRWEALKDKLNDPARRTNFAGPEPKYLLSCIAKCGKCGDTLRAGIITYRNGRPPTPMYQCTGAGCHGMSRSRIPVDDYVTGQVLEYLLRPEAVTLLVPPAVSPGLDPAALRGELRRLADRGRAQMRMHAAGELDDADLAQGKQYIRKCSEEIEAKLAIASKSDPLAEFRDRPADAVWDSLPLPRKRAVIRLLADITLLPVGQGSGPKFRPDAVRIDWKA